MVLDDVKKKKEFRNLSDDFVSRVLVLCSKKYDVTDAKQRKLLVKDARAKLRELYGAFRLRNYNKKEKYLEGMSDKDDTELCEKILAVHLSSKERLDHYPELYKKIRKYVDFRSVLDLGCGFNVFSMPWMGGVVDYYGIDVNKEDVDFCNSYLSKFGLRGAIRWGDVLSFDTFVKTDVCFLFKVLDGYEALERGFTKKLLERISSPYVIVSFATRSLGGKKRISTKRLKWFEELVDIEAKFRLGDEVYYVVRNR